MKANISDTIEAPAVAARLAALSHPVRIEILRHLAAYECCCCKDVVGRMNLAQSTVSQHLRVLVEAGLVRFAQDRQRSRYEIDRPALEALSDDLCCLVRSCSAPCGESIEPKSGTRFSDNSDAQSKF